MSMVSSRKPGLTQNRKARFDYKIGETIEAGGEDYALGATLVKNNAHWRSFETVFEVYFSLRGAKYGIDDDSLESDLADLLDDLGQVAAHAGLDLDGVDDPVEVLGDAVERRAHRRRRDPRLAPDALAERHLATLTTLRPDGTPHVVAVGFTWDGEAGLARVITWDASRKHRNVAERPGGRALEQRLAERGRVALGDDAGAREVRRWVEQVHVTTASPPEPGLPTEDLGGHLEQMNPVRDGEVVGAVRRGDRVVGSQVCADACCDRLLAGRQVHLPRDQDLSDVEPGTLVRVVLAEDGLLVGAAEHHRLVELEPDGGVQGHLTVALLGNRSARCLCGHTDLQTGDTPCDARQPSREPPEPSIPLLIASSCHSEQACTTDVPGRIGASPTIHAGHLGTLAPAARRTARRSV